VEAAVTAVEQEVIPAAAAEVAAAMAASAPAGADTVTKRFLKTRQYTNLGYQSIHIELETVFFSLT
jgi:hypothetical protein